MSKTIIKQLARLDNFILTALFLLTLASCSTETKKEATPSSVDLIAAANELDSLFLVAFNNGDADAILKLYWNSPKLRLYPPGEPQQNGFENVKAWYIKNFASTVGAKLEYISANNIPYADGVIAHGVFRWTMPIEDGSQMSVVSSYAEFKAIKNGKMVIVLDHSSIPMPLSIADSTQTK